MPEQIVRADLLFSKFRPEHSANGCPCGMSKIRIGGIMKKPLMMSACNLVFWVLVAFASLARAQTVGQLIPHKVKLESVNYLGNRAVKITEDGQVANGEAYAVVKDAVFHNGAIEVELAGRPADAASGSRGFFWNAFPLQNRPLPYIYPPPTTTPAADPHPP